MKDKRMTELKLRSARVPTWRAVERYSAGFSMVEALVALMVMAVGMLGIAGLFVMTLKSGGNAINRMQAVNLAQDMADRIRANKTALVAYAGAAAANNCEGPAAVDCTPAQLAANDLFIWQNQIAGINPPNPPSPPIPGGAGVVLFTPPAAVGQPATYSITVSWIEQGQGTTQSAQTAQALSYTLNMQT
jgi:type IV pilus assembly protein PilV